MMMNVQQITALIAKEMQAVDHTISQQLTADTPLINQLGHYIIDSGGKRIRPMIALLAANALNYQGQDHITVAALIEFIHTATLLHDDVVDESMLRRGKSTANAVFGNAASVLVGDFIYTRAFQMMTALGSFPVLKVMSDAVNVIAEGEVMQLMHCNDPDLSQEHYLQVIYSKTARLFEAASQTAAIVANASLAEQRALQLYGRHLGTAFQLIDDLLDYSADHQTLGKNIGDDLNEGKVTLPLLHVLRHCDAQQGKILRQAIEQGNARHLLNDVLHAMQQYGSLDYTQQQAENEVKLAMDAIAMLADSPYKQALLSVAQLSVTRQH